LPSYIRKGSNAGIDGVQDVEDDLRSVWQKTQKTVW
jgi:hypothetical protein